MAYLIRANNPKKKGALEVVKKILQEKDFLFREYRVNEESWIVCYVNPAEELPLEVLKDVTIRQIDSSEARKFGTLHKKEVFESIKPGEGKRVEVIDGPYKGCKGTVLKNLGNGKYQVVISVFEMSVPLIVKEEEIKVI